MKVIGDDLVPCHRLWLFARQSATEVRLLAGVLITIVLLCRSAGALSETQFRTHSLAVTVDVLVTDGDRPVGGLTAADFELRDNDVLQVIDVADAAGVPLNVVVALDTSASVKGTREADLVAATSALVDALSDPDRIALITFNHGVLPRVGLTGDFAAVRKELLRIAPSGRTSVMDATYVAVTATLAQPGRSLVMVCTDGDDVTSWLQPSDVVESARRSNAVVYGVAAGRARPAPSLHELAMVTGGDMVRVASSSDIRGAFQRILKDFRSRYVLAYTPTGVPPGGLHRLNVRVKRRGLTVKSRPSYVGLEGSR